MRGEEKRSKDEKVRLNRLLEESRGAADGTATMSMCWKTNQRLFGFEGSVVESWTRGIKS